VGRDLDRKLRDHDRAVQAKARIGEQLNRLEQRLKLAEAKGDVAKANALRPDYNYTLDRYRVATEDESELRGVVQRDRGN
jgi:hypothetical protein